MLNVSEHFHIQELVHPLYIQEYGDRKMAKYLNIYNPYMGMGLEMLRSFLGNNPIKVNTYKWGGNFINSGWRHAKQPLPGSSLLSGHYFGLKTDCKFRGLNIKDVQDMILLNQTAHPYIVRMESYLDTPTWCDIQWGVRLPDTNIEVFRP